MEVSPQGRDAPNLPDTTTPAPSHQPNDKNESNEANNQAYDALIAVVKEVTAMKQQLAEMKQEVKEVKDHQRSMDELRLDVQSAGMPSQDLKKIEGEDSKGVKKVDPTESAVVSKSSKGPHVDQRGVVRAGQEVYTFNESVWDSLIFLGYIEGSYEGVDMIIIGFINLAIQIFFCALLITLDMANTTSEVYTSQVNDFMQWRIGVAHQAEHYDPLTNSSLAQRVCHKYSGTIESRRHSNDLQVASKYYDVTKDGGSELQGPGLLMLALALWLALILKEVVGILGFTRMLVALALNGNGTTDLHALHDHSEVSEPELEITSLSTRRAGLLFLTVVCPRLFIASLLGYVGIFYLRQTFGVEEIILNAMALGFVLDIDELLFHFLPSASRYATTHTSAVSLEIKDEANKMHTHGRKATKMRVILGAIFERTRILLILLVVVVICFRFTIIKQIQDSMELSQLVLCEGNRDFVFKESRATKVLHVSGTVDTNGMTKMNLPVHEIQDVYDAILQATGLCTELEKKKNLQDHLELCEGSARAVWCDRCDYLRGLGSQDLLWKGAALDLTVSLVTATREEALEQLGCEDRYTQFDETHIPAPMNELLRLAGANFSATLCEDMEQYCTHPDRSIKEVVRIFCPRQCQCDHGTSSTVDNWFFDRIGCAPACQASVNSELKQLEDDLALGREECLDRDSQLTEAQWRTYVEDVQREFVNRGFLHERGGHYYAADSVKDFFALFTRKHMMEFTKEVLHKSNRASVTVGGCTLPETPIDLVAWARQAGSICRWVRIVNYVFGLNLCSHSILLEDGFYGFNSLDGLCPLSCGVGTCSEIKPDGDITSDLNVWYNVMPWGHDSKYGIDCDRDRLVCLEVEKFAKPGRSARKWPDGWTISIKPDSSNAKEVYSAGLDYVEHPDYGSIAYEKDMACIRPENTNSSCYMIESTPEQFFWENYNGMRWRLTEVGTGQLLVMGSHSEMHRACGLNWLKDLGVECHLGDTVSVMTSWQQMTVDGQIIQTGDVNAQIFEDRTRLWLKGLVMGVFSWRKALVQGDYDGTSVSIRYDNPLMGMTETLPLTRLAKPTMKPEHAGQAFAGCLPSTDLAAHQQDRRICQGRASGGLLCTEFVSQVLCESSIGFMRNWFTENSCESDLEGYSDDDTIDKLCPEACVEQAPCDDLVVSPTAYASYYSPNALYYSFQSAGCLIDACQCMTPWDILQECWAEINLTRDWWERPEGNDISGTTAPTTMTTSTIPDVEREIMGSLMKVGTVCLSEATGIPPQTNLMNLTQWCLVRPSCLGSKPSPRQPEHCAWREVSASDCALNDASPTFCFNGPGPHECGARGGGGGGGPTAFPPGMGPGPTAYPPGMGPGPTAYPPGMGPGPTAYPPGMGPGPTDPPGMGPGQTAYPPGMGPGPTAYPPGMGPG